MRRSWAVVMVIIGLVGCGGTPPGTVTPSATPVVTQAPTDAPTSTPAPTATPITYPMRLEQIGQFGGAANVLALNGDTIYLAAGTRVLTVDVSQPAHPTVTGRTPILPGQPASLTTVDHYLLVTFENGLAPIVFDIAGKGDPRPVNDDTARQALSIAPSAPPPGGYTLTYDMSADLDQMPGPPALTIRDEDGKPVITAIRALPGGQIFSAANVAARDHYAFAANVYGMVVYDLSIPPKPSSQPDQMYAVWKDVAHLGVDGGTVDYWCCFPNFFPDISSLCVIDDVLYTGGGGAPWSLAKPEDPQKIASTTRKRTDCDGYPVTGGIIASGTSYDGSYHYLDQSNPANQVLRNVKTGAKEGEVAAVWANTLYYYEHSENHDGSEDAHLLAYDINDLLHPKLVGSYTPPAGVTDGHFLQLRDVDYAWFVAVGHFLYADFTGGSQAKAHTVLDVADPAAIKEVDAPNPDFFEDALLTRDGLVFAASGTDLRIFKEGNLTQPIGVVDFLLGRYRGGDQQLRCRCMAKYGDRLYVWKDRGVAVFDVHDPTHPTVLAASDLTPVSVAAYDDTLYLQMEDRGVEIYKLVPN